MKSTYIKRTGHERYRTFKTDNGPEATARRVSALKRLEAQLISKTKFDGYNLLPLEDKDIQRIKSEISILESRI